MDMHIHLQEPTFAQLKHVSQSTGIQEESLIQRAILYYLDAIQKQLALSAEMDTWDQLSDEALADFEAAL
ncbi:MAG: hypothetical protein GY801_04525 [bacterium]|nr:hypothetical protein [bacterium]